MLNDIKLHGRFGRDPELEDKEGRNGPYKKVSFSLAVDRDFGDQTDWFYCVMMGNRAQVIDKYFKKGSEIIVWGRMESYKNKNDQISWLVKMEGFDFAGSNNSGSAGSSSEPRRNERTETREGTSGSVLSSFDDLPDTFEEAEDDIPF